MQKLNSCLETDQELALSAKHQMITIQEVFNNNQANQTR